MIVQSNKRLIHTNSWLHIKTCKKLLNRIYGLQEKCKNIVMRFQSHLVYIVKVIMLAVRLWQSFFEDNYACSFAQTTFITIIVMLAVWVSQSLL